MSSRPWRREPERKTIHSIEELPVICTTVEVGQLLRCTPEYVSRLASFQIISGFKVGNRWRFRREDVMAYVERLTTGATAS